VLKRRTQKALPLRLRASGPRSVWIAAVHRRCESMLTVQLTTQQVARDESPPPFRRAKLREAMYGDDDRIESPLRISYDYRSCLLLV